MKGHELGQQRPQDSNFKQHQQRSMSCEISQWITLLALSESTPFFPNLSGSIISWTNLVPFYAFIHQLLRQDAEPDHQILLPGNVMHKEMSFPWRLLHFIRLQQKKRLTQVFDHIVSTPVKTMEFFEQPHQQWLSPSIRHPLQDIPGSVVRTFRTNLALVPVIVGYATIPRQTSESREWRVKDPVRTLY